MAKPIKKQNSTLKDTAERNTSVVRKSGTSKDSPEVLKSGVPMNHSSSKHGIPEESHSPRKVGCNIGCTLNMENYESIRIDCWLTDEVRADETFEQAFSRILEIANNQVEEVAQTYRA